MSATRSTFGTDGRICVQCTAVLNLAVGLQALCWPWSEESGLESREDFDAPLARARRDVVRYLLATRKGSIALSRKVGTSEPVLWQCGEAAASDMLGPEIVDSFRLVRNSMS